MVKDAKYYKLYDGKTLDIKIKRIDSNWPKENHAICWKSRELVLCIMNTNNRIG
jgi:hypothetical protein